MTIQVSNDVAAVLTEATIIGTMLKLPAGQLDRKLYASTDKVLNALGGKWDRRKGGHVFPFDPTANLSEILGGKPLVSRQQKLQLFETPPALAERLCKMINVGEGDVCLEPSAGLGRIVSAFSACSPTEIIAVEIDQHNADALIETGWHTRLIVGDFLAQCPSDVSATAIVMNPPFSRNQDIRHVRHAFNCLMTGGRMAAIVSEHSFTGNERECHEWRDWLDLLGACVEVIPPGSFSGSGTSVGARLITLQRS
jgi:predicted RNA methylase